ncbi:MAG: mannose-6-phosphate isomerase, class I [Bacteroidota bacterium]|nr:mannose-6-phosphate isomerase, class I [Bacteroidota bacterium]MDP4197038.1 mannose-6-phosphate isomerase, class I [Bacteroidota bacterium]
MKSEQQTIQARPYILKNKIQNYEWGARGKDAVIPSLLGFEPEEGKPYAELWIGAHPKASSVVEFNETEIPLNEFVKQDPEGILGIEAAKKFANKLPFLLKVLSAAEALSIQAHPDLEKAAILHKKDPKNYPDDNHKPEIAIALDSLTALAGFKPFDEFLDTIKKYKGLCDLIGFSKITEAEKQANDSEVEKSSIVKSLYESIMKASVSDPKKLQKAIEEIKSEILNRSIKERQKEEIIFLELEKKYGSDVGLISVLIFNLLELNEGEAIFLNAGIPHAYLKGNIVECMANSDNVVRAGLTPKFKDIDSLLYILSDDIRPVEKMASSEKSSETKYNVPIGEFDITRFKFSKAEKRVLSNDSASIILVMKGEISLSFGEEVMVIKKGDTVLLPAMLKEFSADFSINSLAFKVSIP